MLSSDSMKGGAFLIAHWIQLCGFVLPARAPFVYRWELSNNDSLACAHSRIRPGRGMFQRWSGVASARDVLLAVDDQFASRGPGIADISLAHQRLVRKGLAHQPGEQMAGDFELLGMCGHENSCVWGKSSSNQESLLPQELASGAISQI
ncbi:hypothetical protein ASF90_03500 [Xanthomonas sp. Leaf148]|nr:hypothetical protein ASF90_03500 [Xanthomonas sp. Leaf148]